MNINTDRNNSLHFNEDETTIDFIKILIKYLRYWPWFIITLIVSVSIAFLYLRYANVVYLTQAKVRLIDDKKKSNFSLDISKVFSKSTINLENEIALFKSYNLSEKVVRNLKLNITYISKGKINSKIDYCPPFELSYTLAQDSLTTPLVYDIIITKTGYKILDKDSGKDLKTKGYWLNSPTKDFPIVIRPSSVKDINLFADFYYRVILKPIKLATIELSNEIKVEPFGKESDIITLTLKNTDGKHAEKILNGLVKVFENDGVMDSQEVSRKTIDFVNERLVFLKQELDVIESSKKEYKKSNNLSFLQGDTEESIKMKSVKEQSLFEIDSQLLLVELLYDNLMRQEGFELLPADIGIQNQVVNQMVMGYNTTVSQYRKMLTSAGVNNPNVQVLSNTLTTEKKNILNSVAGYKQQLEANQNQSHLAKKAAQGSFASIPEKEKVLRSIERQQNLKESLYLLLLQKREEASINLAVTVPNTKIIDYAITNNIPVSPKKSVTIIVALLLGISIPLGILYIRFRYDNKIYNAADVQNSSTIPVLGELPSLDESNNEGKDNNSEVSEAFNTLAHNAEFITPYNERKEGKVYLVTSTIKGEGKTFVSFNLTHSFAKLDKKVLLIGTDLRNPQLHKYFNENLKLKKGLSNYLHNSSLHWKDLIIQKKQMDYAFDVLLSGDIPPNSLALLSNRRFSAFVEDIKQVYDVIIFDTAPTLLVSDSLIISKHADTTLYVMRSGVTERKLLLHSSKLQEDKKLINMGYVINAIDFKNGYNYGHSYGYDSVIEEKSWFRRLFKKS